MFSNILNENATQLRTKGSSNEKWNELLLIFGAYALDRNTAMLEKVGGSSWDIDNRAGAIYFKKHGPVKIQVLGSYYRNHGQWVWSWAHGDLKTLPIMTKAAVMMRSIGVKHGITRLTTPVLECGKSVAHNMAFVSSGCVACGGYFAVELGDNTKFVLLDRRFLNFTSSAKRIVEIFKEFSKTQPDNHKNSFRHYLYLNRFKCNVGANHIVAKRGDEQIIASFEKDRVNNIYY